MKAVVADALNYAADLIETYGWCQNVSSTDDGRICLDTAIHMAAKTAGLPFADVAWAWRGEDPERGPTGYWNDQPGRTQSQVIASLHAAANTADTRKGGQE